MVHRIGHAFNLAECVVGIGRSLTHGIGYGKRLIERVINSLTNRVTLRIGGLDNVAVSVVSGGEHVSACIGDGSSPAERIVAVTNDVVQSILDCEQIVVLVIGVSRDVVLCVGCGESVGE